MPPSVPPPPPPPPPSPPPFSNPHTIPVVILMQYKIRVTHCPYCF